MNQAQLFGTKTMVKFLPPILQYYNNIVFAIETLNPTSLAAGLYMQSPTCVQKNSPTGSWRSVLVGDGHKQGKYFYEFTIVEPGSDKRIMLGISKHGFSVESYPGSDANSVGFYCFQNCRYSCGSSSSFDTGVYSHQCVIGMLMDLDSCTLQFYLNGKSLGAAFGSDKISYGSTWFPTIGLYDLGQVVSIQTVPAQNIVL